MKKNAKIITILLIIIAVTVSIGVFSTTAASGFQFVTESSAIQDYYRFSSVETVRDNYKLIVYTRKSKRVENTSFRVKDIKTDKILFSPNKHWESNKVRKIVFNSDSYNIQVLLDDGLIKYVFNGTAWVEA